MKGYSKIKGNNSFIQRSKSNKEFVFLDTDFDVLSSKSTNKRSHLVNEQESSIPDLVNSNKKVGFFIEKPKVVTGFELEKQEEYDNNGGDHHSLKQGSEKTGGVLRRNFSVSSANSSYQKNKGNNNNTCLERQSSTRAIQEAVKRAFSIRRSSSVNSDRYCRIYDQPKMKLDDCDNYDYANHDDMNNTYNHHDDDLERNGSLNTRYVSMVKNTDHHNHGKKHVGSKVVRACKRLFSR